MTGVRQGGGGGGGGREGEGVEETLPARCFLGNSYLVVKGFTICRRHVLI